MGDKTSISVEPRVADVLYNLKNRGETYNELLIRLLVDLGYMDESED